MLKLHAGVSKKVGLPGFSSASASCTIEAELDSSLLQDHEGFQIVVAAGLPVVREGRAGPDRPADQRRPSDDTSPAAGDRRGPHQLRPSAAREREQALPDQPQFTNQPSPRPATASQVKAIRAIAARRKIDLVGLLRERFGLTTADELGIRQASNLIDELKGDEPTSQPQRTATGPTRRLGVLDDRRG